MYSVSSVLKLLEDILPLILIDVCYNYYEISLIINERCINNYIFYLLSIYIISPIK